MVVSWFIMQFKNMNKDTEIRNINR